MNNEFDLINRHLVNTKDLNFHGNLHGGVMLHWIDEDSYVFASDKIGYSNLVTVSLENVRFENPGRSGDIVNIFGHIKKIGRSSLEIQICALVKRSGSTEPPKNIITCDITFVCLKDGKPYSYFKTPEFLARKL